jgi:competence ComEA-like helix-hairpin-helix protein
MADKLNRWWLAATLAMIIIIIVSSLVIWSRRDKGQPIAISLSHTPQASENAGITNSVAGLSRDSSLQPQKVDINRADIWLLQALPGIGEVRARSIVDFRNQNGLFSTPQDLTRVPGISESVVEKIKAYITVGENQ